VSLEGVVSPGVVVVVDPWCQSVGPVVVGSEDLLVGPLDLKGSVESFDLAVLPGAVGFDENVFRSQACDDRSDSVAVFVAPMVVGHDLFDLFDAVFSEEDCCALQEPGGGFAFLVVEDLAVGQTRVVIDHGVDEVVANAGAFLCCG